MSTVNGFQVGSEILKYNYESLENYNTPNFSTSSSDNYAVGDYVIYNGKLYKCTTATTGGTWASDNWTEAVLSDDVSELNHQIDDLDSDKQDAPSTAGTAGQVLSLDDQLHPVWADQTGGSSEDAAPVIINTASGDIAIFADGADNRQIRKIVGTIVPVQSGAGDPSPDNVRPISGWTGANIANNGNNWLKIALGTVSSGSITATSDGESITITGTETNTYGFLFLNGSGLQYASSLANAKQMATTFDVPLLKKGFNYAWNIFETTGGETVTPDYFYAFTKLGVIYPFSVTGVGTTKLIDNDVVAFALRLQKNNTYNGTFKIALVQGTVQPVIYESYYGTTLPINWQTEAGTIYGGTVTLNEDGSADVSVIGILDRLNPTANESIWQWSGGGRLTFTLSGMIASIYDTLCNQLAFTTDATTIGNDANLSNYLVSNTSDGYTRILLHIKDATDKASTLQYLQNNNVMLYRRMNSVVNIYHIPNAGQLYTYLGTNNVWIDTGTITECDYPADTKLFLTARDEEITGNIAPIENGTTASKAYAQGAYFWHDTKFCKALVAIASGATFTLGTNYQETTVAAELLAAQN